MSPKTALGLLLLAVAGGGYGAGLLVTKHSIAPQVVEVEKLVEVPVEKIVEKKIEIPVEVIKEVVKPCPVCAARAERDEERDQRHDVVISVSALDLFAAYSANEVAADKKYKGKRLKVTGLILRIRTGPFVVLEADRSDAFAGVDCTFSRKDEDDVASLKKGEIVTILGTCEGYLLGSVGLQKCAIHKE